MTNEFSEVLFSRLNTEERIFKFKSAEISGNVLNISFMVRADTYDTILDERLKKKVKDIALSFLPNDIKLNINYIKTYSDEKQIKNSIIEFIYNQHKTVYPVFTNAKYNVNISGDYVEVQITLEKYVCDYAKGIGLAEKIVDFLDKNFMENSEVYFISIPNTENSEILNAVVTTDSSIRVIDVKQGVSYAKGAGILDYPRYIKDVIDEEKEVKNVNICGVVSDVKSRKIKLKQPRKDGREEIDLYTFTLNDTTGATKVKYFTKSEKVDWERVFLDSAQLVMSGDYLYDSYENRFIFQPKAISSAEINFESINTKSNFNKDYGRYLVIEPEMCSDIAQDDLFTDSIADANEKMGDTVYCVFDLETTGLDVNNDEIVEIAAIKIKSGEFIEQFSTFVKPIGEISAQASEKTGITMDMVKDAPSLKDVLHDFYRFSKDTVLVGHNIASFDIPILNAQGEKVKYVFENEYIDTLTLARQKLKMGRYNLGAVCEKLKIPLINAHRALNDVGANAKIFLRLMKY